MSEYIEREAVMKTVKDGNHSDFGRSMADLTSLREVLEDTPAADVVEVVRCKDCKFATELDKYCELNRAIYKHCSLLRGEPINYVWHKYKRYYKNYSLVEADDYCSYGERKDGDE